MEGMKDVPHEEAQCFTNNPSRGPYREPIKDILRRVARRLRDKAHALESLADRSDGMCLSGDAEEAFREMVYDLVKKTQGD